MGFKLTPSTFSLPYGIFSSFVICLILGRKTKWIYRSRLGNHEHWTPSTHIWFTSYFFLTSLFFWVQVLLYLMFFFFSNFYSIYVYDGPPQYPKQYILRWFPKLLNREFKINETKKKMRNDMTPNSRYNRHSNSNSKNNKI